MDCRTCGTEGEIISSTTLHLESCLPRPATPIDVIASQIAVNLGAHIQKTTFLVYNLEKHSRFLSSPQQHMAKKIKTTPRSYTLRLSRTDSSDTRWRELLWRTHAAINQGTKVFGDFLLTFCGGIDHRLAELDADKKEMGTLKDRRIILALSWLSVEDEDGAPEAKYHVAPAETENALRNILKKRGLGSEEIKSWLDDCRNSISAAIRNDAVWVDRSMMFDELSKEWKMNKEAMREEIWDFLALSVVPFPIIKQNQYMLPVLTKDMKQEKESEENDGPKSPKPDKAKEMSKAALNWLSKRLGSGGGSDFEMIFGNLSRFYDWCEVNRKKLEKLTGPEFQNFLAKAELNLQFDKSGKGVTSKLGNMYASPSVLSTDQIDGLLQTTQKARDETKKKIGGKGERPYAVRIRQKVEEKTGVLFSQIKTDRKGKAEKSADVGREMFCVMLDHAARKLISRLSWIKNAEARRNEFETNLSRLDDVSEAARTFLDQYCEERTKTSNAEDEYRIRRAAVAGWKEVLAAWKKCKTAEKRIDAVRDMQGDFEKFGDVNLFTDLAADGAEAVWNDFDPDILTDYVAGKQAEYDKQRFKVPAYRHPDPLSHPVFCDFGESRPGVKFSVRENFEKWTSSKPGEIELRRLNIDLISDEDSSIVTGYPLRWRSKRLGRDIGLGLIENGELADSKTKIAEEIPRLDRFGKSEWTTEKRTIDIYTDKSWNSRLQISRNELDQIANDLKKNGGDPFDKSTWSDRARKMLDRVKWFVSFSPKLRYPDAWDRYRRLYPETGENLLPKYFRNENIRSGNGLLRYIPGLRILSIDLGHRFGASCAVWEVVSKKQIEAAAKKSGQSVPGKSDVFFTINKKTKDKKGKSFTQKTVYRRIALDSVKDACWARLDRQFTIKLQGEDRNPRSSTPKEIKDAEKFFKQIGLELPEKRAKKLNRIDRLLEELVRAMRLRLKRHGNLKRAEREFTAETVILPGNKTEILKTDEAKKERILSAIRILFELRQTRHWTCSKEIETFWKENIVPLLTAEAAKLDKDASRDKKKTDDEMEEPSKQRRQADGQKWDETFEPVAKAMLKKNRKAWSKELERIWAEDDILLKAKMKELRRLILPRPGKEKKANGKITKEFRESISRRGGLSVNRINTIRELYQISKAFFMRPGGGNDKIEKGDDSIRNFGKRILDIHERLRQNRVKQLASRIVEAALGLGGGFEGKEQDKHREESCCTMRQFLDRKRDQKAPEGDPRFRPVHVVVTENLDNYRPDQMQARRESRMLMQWASGKVRDILKDHCQLYGLFLMQVGAAYTSQQDSRTGMPGMRCVAVPVSEFTETGLIGKRVKKIREKKESERTPTDRLLVDLAARCQNISGDDSKKTLLIPKRGGDLFVAADGKGQGIQADLNAAANIGLKALTDYDCPIFFWKIACTPQGKPAVRKGEKYKLLEEAKEYRFLPTNISEANTPKEKKGKKKEERNYNAWRDISCDPLADDSWRYTKDYWADVEKRVCEKLRQLNNVIFDKIESPF